MKYLLSLLVLLLGFMWWKSRRAQEIVTHERQPPASPPAKPLKPVAMVACTHCGLHLPAQDAIERKGAVYCSAEHAQSVP